MFKRLAAASLVLGLLPSAAFAQSIRESAAKEVAKLAQAQTQRPSSAGENPYRTPAIVLMGGGAALALVGLEMKSCSIGIGTDYSVNCGSNKGVMFAGLGAAGLGAVLFARGESQRRPFIAAIPGGVYIGKRIKF